MKKAWGRLWSTLEQLLGVAQTRSTRSTDPSRYCPKHSFLVKVFQSIVGSRDPCLTLQWGVSQYHLGHQQNVGIWFLLEIAFCYD